jgi:hypothetical protein
VAGLLGGRLPALNGQTLSGFFVFAWQEPGPGGLYEVRRPGRTRPYRSAQVRGGSVSPAEASCGPPGGTCRGAWQRDRAAQWITGVLGMWRGWLRRLPVGAYPWSGGVSAVVPVAIAIRRSRYVTTALAMLSLLPR